MGVELVRLQVTQRPGLFRLEAQQVFDAAHVAVDHVEAQQQVVQFGTTLLANLIGRCIAITG